MDALAGRAQTTRGIWLARSPKVAAPPTLVLDLEGSDGRERGEDDTSFERQSALFALAAADVVLVNMWAKDVGREAGAGKPLLKTIFQVNLKLFHPAPGARRAVLLFVFRDRTKTPLERLAETWGADLERMWAGIAKPPAYEAATVADFFDVRYAALSNYEDRPDDFLADATILRRRFTDDGEGPRRALAAALAAAAVVEVLPFFGSREPPVFVRCPRRRAPRACSPRPAPPRPAADDGDGFLLHSPDKLPGQALALSLSKVWEVVRDNRDLSLPAHRVMVANIRCAEIAGEQLAAFAAEGGAWAALAAAAAQGPAPGFGAAAGAAVRDAMAAYDAEARYFDAATSAARAAALAAELAALVRPAYEAQLALARRAALASFRAGAGAEGGGQTFVARCARASAAAMAEFDQLAADAQVPGAEWGAAEAREALARDLAAHEAELRAAHVAAAQEAAGGGAAAGVSAGAMPLLEAPPPDLWPRLAAVVDREAAKAGARLEAAVQGYGLAASEVRAARAAVAAAARARLLACAREAANTALPRLKDYFVEAFQRDEQGTPRTWTTAVDVPAVAAAARRAAAALLAQLCVVRLGPAPAPAPATTGAGSSGSPASDTTPEALAAVEAAVRGLAEERAAAAAPAAGGFDLLSASEWPGVAPADVLLSPAQARTAWRQFSSDSALSVQQAVATQEANRLAQNRLPPLWAIAAMLVLGANEAVAVLRNPLLLLVLVAALMFARTVYAEMGVEEEMQRGLLPGALALSAKFVPTVKAVAWRTVESGRALLADGPASPHAAGGGGADAGAGEGEAGGRLQVRYDTTPARPEAAAGLRGRRREVEMTQAPAAGGEEGGGRKDD
jgi:hypothetical protein